MTLPCYFPTQDSYCTEEFEWGQREREIHETKMHSSFLIFSPVNNEEIRKMSTESKGHAKSDCRGVSVWFIQLYEVTPTALTSLRICFLIHPWIPPSNRKPCTLLVKRAMNYGLRFYPGRKSFHVANCSERRNGSPVALADELWC